MYVNQIIVITTTLPTLEEAQHIAETLVTRKLCACAQIAGPLQSIYPWKGNLEKAQEYKLSLKAPCSHKSRLKSALHSMHPYEIAEIVLTDTQVSQEYYQWLDKECAAITEAGDDQICEST